MPVVEAVDEHAVQRLYVFVDNREAVRGIVNPEEAFALR